MHADHDGIFSATAIFGHLARNGIRDNGTVFFPSVVGLIFQRCILLMCDGISSSGNHICLLAAYTHREFLVDGFFRSVTPFFGNAGTVFFGDAISFDGICV